MANAQKLIEQVGREEARKGKKFQRELLKKVKKKLEKKVKVKKVKKARGLRLRKFKIKFKLPKVKTITRAQLGKALTTQREKTALRILRSTGASPIAKMRARAILGQ